MENELVIPKGPVLVLLVGPSGAGKSTWANAHFDPWEIVSADSVREGLFGNLNRQDHPDLIFEEVYHRAEIKLRAGQRAVIDATHIRNVDRRRTAEIGIMLNVPVFYVVINRSLEAKMRHAGWRVEHSRSNGVSLIEAHETTFAANVETILAGDHLREVTVFDVREGLGNTVRVARHLPRDGQESLRCLTDQGYSKIRVIPDIHGNLNGLMSVLSDVDHDTFLLFLGDVVDYGPRPWATLALVNRLVSRGEAAMVVGNHDAKITRYVRQTMAGKEFGGKITHGNDVTVDQLKAMSPEQRQIAHTQMISLFEQSPNWIEMGSWMFSHGGVHPKMWGNPLFRAIKNSYLETVSLYGETDGTTNERGLPTRTYNWVKEVPEGMNAVVGHQIMSVEGAPVWETGTGGRVVFLDTGSAKGLDGKDGFLSFMDMEIVDRRKGRLDLNLISFGAE